MGFVVIITCLGLSIPLIAILSTHQQKMAEIVLKQGDQANSDNEVQTLRAEVKELKELIHQQTILLDTLATQSRSNSLTTDELKERINL